VNTQNLLINNFIQSCYIKNEFSKSLSKDFNKSFFQIERDIKVLKKTLNILDKNFKLNFKAKDLKRFNKFKKISIIGMGGSILGIQAVYNFFKKKIKKKVYFFDDIDQEKILNFKNKNNLKKILFIVISKSGNTVETLSNMFFLKILKKNSNNIIVISENKNNTLFKLSKKLNLFYIEHNNYIGGRYSIFSETGIVPAYLMGINISKFKSKTLFFLRGKQKIFLKNSSLKLANIMKTNKLKSLIFLNYSPKLEKFLFWCQQLIAESLGKKNKGFLPVISNVPKDHHSLLQLYLDGPKDKIFYIFSLTEKFKDFIKVNKIFDKNIFLNNKSLTKVKEAQSKALIKAFKKNKIPFREFKIKKLDEETLGKLFSYFILETVTLGKLLKINPFNQPAVEQVKIYTKKLLI
tara:strand:+ start:1902 stop:3119 length:1218 start_codon:yes stop_codon:yes gene_type:complete